MKDEPVYIVSSFHRSGSSMMMRCLEAGGLTPVFEEVLDRIWDLNYSTQDYHPNPNGFYHMDDYMYDWPSFYQDTKGKVIKVPRADLQILREGKYKVIFMVRNPEEIRASMRKFVPHQSWGQVEVNTYFYDQIKEATLSRARLNKGLEILEINYADVVENPEREFAKIKKFGFPIDTKAASAMVEPNLYRLKLEQK